MIELAGYYGWARYHTLDSRGSDPGWPDLVLVRAPELLVAELKTAGGRVTAAQQRWLDRLEACGLEVYVWRPSDLERVHKRLKWRPS